MKTPFESTSLVSGQVIPPVKRGHRLWRKSLLTCVFLAAIILIVNLSLVGWASHLEMTEDGSYIAMRGSCNNVSKASLSSHLVINILSTLLLGASNYCMQIAIAPSRNDLDEAHSKGRWFDIGVPSIRNLRCVSKWRKLVWILLCLSSLPLHLFYNSIVFTSQVTTEYIVSELDGSFLFTRADTNLTNLSISNAEGARPGLDRSRVEDIFGRMLTESATQWDNLSSADCAHLYTNTMMTTHRTLVLVAPTSTDYDRLPGKWRLTGNYVWMCDQPGKKYHEKDKNDANGVAENICRPSKAKFGLRDSSIPPAETEYCLAEPFLEDCKLEISVTILAVVIVANAVKVAAMITLFFQVGKPSLITIGDAIASFLERHDGHTRNLSTRDFSFFKKPWPALDQRCPVPWSRRHHRRKDAISTRRFINSYALFTLAICIVILLLTMALRADAARGTPIFTSLLSKNHFAIIGFESLAGASLLDIVLLVNTPQLIVSMLYFLFNSMITAYVQAAEWNAISRAPQKLRVSKPIGSQVSTYWLSLPPVYGVPMLIFSAMLHWLISQAIFLSKIEFQDFNGGRSERFGGAGYGNMYGDHPGKMLAAGYSSLGILLALILGAVGILALTAVGCLRLKGDMVLVGSCSAAIAASCREVGYGVDYAESIWTSEISWGELDHHRLKMLGFSSDGHLRPPRNGQEYS
ncbi:hypothetical protein ONS95_007882 [Cadophora gregata]|uniref:uncharacterized protein n=1 Tax=Cadophora gregata TaxID=51156 RepID=UPI0026DBAEBF|nr:uncharacterized protein ONS95_007882 [Cadophora gregata]KAK0119018.1 hypothetical protein ONS96_012087 [Cadophora gregata f. sp. sojae]KAK0126270.1 hypothetical protein ONS95_007882 [Cadophora gregata]